jgi:hypothetical protein
MERVRLGRSERHQLETKKLVIDEDGPGHADTTDLSSINSFPVPDRSHNAGTVSTVY